MIQKHFVSGLDGLPPPIPVTCIPITSRGGIKTLVFMPRISFQIFFDFFKQDRHLPCLTRENVESDDIFVIPSRLKTSGTGKVVSG